ncbi:hypothetical protein ACH5RR_028885 [Cinchona calisaya]|uniref:Uncharacterized protein n=1 Tax=Cinchona calisaya TaxID=153742 RepID=A0ABD2YTL6_9GENT
MASENNHNNNIQNHLKHNTVNQDPQGQLPPLLRNYEGIEEFKIAIDELEEEKHIAFANDNMDHPPSQELDSDSSKTSITNSRPAQDSTDSENLVIRPSANTNENNSSTIIDDQSGYVTDDEDEL